MKRSAILLATVGVALVGACGQQETGDEVVANNIVEAAPVNAAIPAEESNVSEGGNTSATEAVGPAPRVAPAPEPRSAPGAERQIMPLERRVDRVEPAPKQEPAPAPTSNCTPDHEAMGHCKQ